MLKVQWSTTSYRKCICFGVTFDKESSTLHAGQNCDTYRGSLTHPSDCQWENCQLPSSISSQAKHVQMTMTMAIFFAEPA